MSNIKVAIIMGSESDAEEMKHASDILDKLKIKSESLVISAHRTPTRLHKFLNDAKKNKIEIIYFHNNYR